MIAAPTTILVATDFSPTSKDALEYGRMLAEHFGASLHLLHVCERPAMAAALTEGYANTMAEVQKELRRIAGDRLASMIAPDWIVPVTTEVVTGPPARSIVEVAGDRGVSLIVIGTHGYGGVAHLVLGSVAEHVVRTALCPVLTIGHRSGSATKQAAPAGVAAAV
jgi:universal stress protein A